MLYGEIVQINKHKQAVSWSAHIIVAVRLENPENDFAFCTMLTCCWAVFCKRVRVLCGVYASLSTSSQILGPYPAPTHTHSYYHKFVVNFTVNKIQCDIEIELVSGLKSHHSKASHPWQRAKLMKTFQHCRARLLARIAGNQNLFDLCAPSHIVHVIHNSFIDLFSSCC